jgi:hypothetical protein
MSRSTVRFATYPRTEPPRPFAEQIVAVFRKHESAISTETLGKGLTSDQVLAAIADDIKGLGVQVEAGKGKEQRIERPVFYGEEGRPVVRYQIDAYHPVWKCGLEVEAGRAWMGNAVYKDLVQATVMVEVDHLCLAVPNAYKYSSEGRSIVSKDFDNTRDLAEALYSHTRLKLPYSLLVIGY